MRRIHAALFACLLVPSIVEAKPSRHGVDAFKGDRWEMVVAQGGTSASDVNRIMRCPAPIGRGCRVKRTIKPKKWKKPRTPPQEAPGVVHPISRKSVVPVPRARPNDTPDADEDAAIANGVWNRIAVSLNLLEAPRVLRGHVPAPLNIFEGFAREIMRALPRRGVSLAGVVPRLAEKVRELQDKCGAIPTSAVRRTYVRGSGRRSLHWDGKAVDVVGNPKCMYPLVAKWPGGVSTDYWTVRCGARRCPHMHISLDEKGRREMRARFAHRGGVKRTRYARHQRQRYASAR